MTPRFGAVLVFILSFPSKQVLSSCPCSVTSFGWWDADTNYPAYTGSVSDGKVYYERDFEQSIEAVARCTDGTTPEGVVLEMSGTIETSRTERRPPFMLFGDIDRPPFVHGRDFTPGSYHLEAHLIGMDCGTLAVDFTVVAQAMTCPCFTEEDLSLDVFAMPKDPSVDSVRNTRNLPAGDNGFNEDYWQYDLPDAGGSVSVETSESFYESLKECRFRYTLCDENDYPDGDSCVSYNKRLIDFTGEAGFRDCETLANRAAEDRKLPCYVDLPDDYDEYDSVCYHGVWY